jgi:TIR domain
MKIFISYSRGDAGAVESMARDLETVGHQVWIDRQISGGAAWWDEILARVQACDVVVFALSPTSLRSEACRSENGYAQRLGKAILPVEVQVVNRKLLPPELGRLQIVDYCSHVNGEFAVLLRSLQSLPPPRPLPSVLPPPPVTPVSYLIKVKQYLTTPYQLTDSHQYQILRALTVGLQSPDDHDEAQQLLLELRSRQDTTAAIASEIDRLRSNNTRSAGAGPSTAVAAWTRSQYVLRLVFCLLLSPIAALIIWGDNKNIPARARQSRRIVVWTVVIYVLLFTLIAWAASHAPPGTASAMLLAICPPGRIASHHYLPTRPSATPEQRRIP